ncbi:MAG: type II secretion system F family protein [Dehalococcoidales bacterium]|nr:type II secretion system F family protein [Dehalococcoidales bacterium]
MYQYEAYTLDKEIVQGTIDAPNEGVAEERLNGAGYHQILTLKKTSPTLSASVKRLFHLPSSVKKSEFTDFFYQLATLLDSRMPFVQALWVLAEQTHNPALRDIISKLGRDVSSGIPFSLTLGQYPKLISSHYCQVIRVSEKSGDLTRGLRLVAGYIEKEASLSGHVKRMLSYPSFLGLASLIVIIIVATVAVPSLTKLFDSLGVDLPLVTQILVACAGFITTYKFHLGAGILAIIGIVFLIKKSPGAKKYLDMLALSLPIVSNIVIMRNICRFCRSSAMLIEAGLTLPQALNAIIGTIDNTIIRNALKEIRQETIKGKGLWQPMEKSGLFPRLLVDVVAIGEKSGSLQSSFSTMADYYEKRLDQRVQKLLSMIEPASIILVGLIISFIGIAIITPLYSIYQNVA